MDRLAAKRHKMSRPFFVPLLAVYPVLFIAASNPGQVRRGALLIALLSALLGSSVLLPPLRLLLGTWARASVGAGVFLVVFYLYGPVHTAIEFWLFEWISSTSHIDVPTTLLQHLHPGLTAVAALALAGGLAVVGRLPASSITAAIRALNVFGLSLTVFVAIQSGVSWSGSLAAETSNATANQPGRQTSILGYNPDIYVIVLDGYARADVLAEQYGFDNSPFLDRLQELGFRISARSTSNYHWTSLSLSSALNMDYLEPLYGKAIDPRTRSRRVVHEGIRNNALMRFLAARGYRTYHLGSTWGGTLENEHAAEQIPCRSSVFNDDFLRTVVNASWVKVLESRMNVDLATCHLTNFATLRRLGGEPGPKFVFAHFLLPHHPYLFDSSGRILRQATFSNQFEFQRRLWEDRRSYIEQLRFVNAQVLRGVEAILAASSRPPVIVVMSDHGANIQGGLTPQQVLRVRFANLGAYLLPGAPESAVPSPSSLVNLYRAILNHYFEAGLERLPDRYYTSAYETPFDLTEVGAE